MRTETLLKLL